jgi:hypothetical protein
LLNKPIENEPEELKAMYTPRSLYSSGISSHRLYQDDSCNIVIIQLRVHSLTKSWVSFARNAQNAPVLSLFLFLEDERLNSSHAMYTDIKRKGKMKNENERDTKRGAGAHL